MAYRNRSPFKVVSGAYQLVVTTPSGRSWNVFYKDVRYCADGTADRLDIPVTIGAPEYAVYSTADAMLRQYLPTVYRSEEVEPRRRYRYLLEDVGPGRRKPVESKDLLRAAAAIPDLSTTVRDWAHATGERRLLLYDRSYIERLRPWVRKVLAGYATQDQGGAIEQLLADWGGVDQALAWTGAHECLEPSGVHGDLNRASLLVGDDGEPGLKVVDWEWAGLGLPHLDLASLLERARPGLVAPALDTFARSFPQVSRTTHARLYDWACLVKHLKNTSFLAEQELAGAATTVDRRAYVDRLARLALATYARL